MNGKCLDIGIIQAFLDGEIRPEQAVKISEHVDECDPCTILLAQAEEENSLVFSVLDRELNALVPTQRLWSRINESIAEEKSHASVWQRFLGFLTATLANPSFAAAAGILLFVGVGVIVWISKPAEREATAGQEVTFVSQPNLDQAEPAPVASQISDPVSNAEKPMTPKAASTTDLSDKEVENLVRYANDVQLGPRPVKREFASAPQYLPGEESYIKTINELEQTVTVQNASMNASSQVAFAQDLGVVDNSIKKMREVVRRNPRNQAARQVLYSSYQDKIDLLKSSAQRNELMASLQ